MKYNAILYKFRNNLKLNIQKTLKFIKMSDYQHFKNRTRNASKLNLYCTVYGFYKIFDLTRQK